jgi:CheY-like chemotaxis protein
MTRAWPAVRQVGGARVDRVGMLKASAAWRKLILIVDDSGAAAALGDKLARCAASHETIAVKDGRAALEMALERYPDAALLDVDLPLIGGIEAAQAMHKLFGEYRPLSIALTAGPGAERARQLGVFDDVLVKPIDIDRLLRLLNDGSPRVKTLGRMRRW